jgi:hypothetical protein
MRLLNRVLLVAPWMYLALAAALVYGGHEFTKRASRHENVALGNVAPAPPPPGKRSVSEFGLPEADSAVAVGTDAGQQHLAASSFNADLATASWWAACGLILLAVYGRRLAEPPARAAAEDPAKEAADVAP